MAECSGSSVTLLLRRPLRQRGYSRRACVRRARRPPPWPALLTFLAADHATGLHEHIPDWLAFYFPVLVASFICLFVVSRGPSGRTKFRAHRAAGLSVDGLIGAGLLLLTFSFLLHGLGWLVSLGISDTTGFAYQAKAAVKHATEIAGWFIVALGLLRLGLPARGP